MSEAKEANPVSGPISDPETTLHTAVSMALAPQKTEDQSLPASPNGAPAAAEAQMSALDTCGMYGGVALDGTPCERPSAFGVPGARYGITQGRCFHHTSEALDKVAKRKAEFLERYMEQPIGLQKLCEQMDMSCSQPYLWKLTDVGFRKTFEALVVIVDAVRQHLAEDAMFERICNVEAGADTLRMFYHQNRSNGRWRDVRKDPAPSSGTTIIQAGGDVTVNNTKVWQVGDDFVSF